MKRYHAILTVTIVMALTAFTTSCQDYDDDQEFLSNVDMAYNATLATLVEPNFPAGVATIKKDNEEYAYVVNPGILSQYGIQHAGDRMFCRYIGVESPAGAQDSRAPYIHITELQQILTKDIDILTDTETDVYGNDGINCIAHHLGKEYLTLQFQIYGSNTGIKHRISLVAKEGDMPDKDGLLAVELRHNAEGDGMVFMGRPGYVSFSLAGAPGYDEGTLKGFKITYRSISDGKRTVTISYVDTKALQNFPFAQETWSNTKIK